MKSSATIEILKALLPYSDQNLKLTYHPTRFLDDLEKVSGYSRPTLHQSYSRLKNSGYITDEKTPKLTAKGRRHIQPFVASKLPGGAQLMVIFDVPEDFGEQRRQLRNILRQLGFKQTQRSVWVTDADHTTVLSETVRDLRLGDWVEVYEVKRLY